MNPFAVNLLLALVWAAATEHFTPGNLFVGFILGFLVLFFLQPHGKTRAYFVKTRQLIGFAGFFFYELFRANFQVAHDVVTPPFYMRPGIIAVPLDAKTDLEISLLGILITLMPGSLSLDVSDDRKVLFIHAMFIEDPEKTRREIKDGFERRLLELLR
jgi:multicomponent Na+:H+ antiporter subunit E